MSDGERTINGGDEHDPEAVRASHAPPGLSYGNEEQAAHPQGEWADVGREGQPPRERPHSPAPSPFGSDEEFAREG
jgi:hypothetical protein